MVTVKYTKPIWFNIDKNKLLNNPNDSSYVKTSFNKKDVNIKTSIFKTNNTPVIKYEPNESFNIYNGALQLINEYQNKLTKLIDSKNLSETKIKSLTTKLLKKSDELNSVIRVKKYPLNLNEKQKTTIQSWIKECKMVYNKCVDKHNTNNEYFKKGFKSIKASLFEEIYKDTVKSCPYDVLTDEVRIFGSNLKSCFTNLKNANIKHFEIKKKLKQKSNYSLLISSRAVYDKGFYKTILEDIKDFKLNELPSHDCRLFYCCKSSTYTLMIPTKVTCEPLTNREDIVAIDPGEKKFIEFYGLKSYGYIGKDIRKPLLKLRDRISKYQKILDKTKINKSGNKLKNRRHIKKKITKLQKKIKHIVKELHNQSANYLCKNYEKILIPKFETQKMISHKHKSFKEFKTETINKGKTEEERKQIAKNLIKKCRLSRKVKYVLNTLSHFSFRQHLTEKSVEHGCQLKIITEEFTSLTCTNCGHMSEVYNRRVKECEYCKNKIDRDLNGARNILLKNLEAFKYKHEAYKSRRVPTSQIRKIK